MQESECVMNQKPEGKPDRVASKMPSPAEETQNPPDRWSWVERSVWTERMLSRLGTTELKNRVWYTLVDKTYGAANLRSAYEKVRANRGGSGVDGQTLERFAEQAGPELERLAGELRSGRYRPRPVRRTWIDKPGSTEKRPLGIPAVRDRIVQGAVRHVLEPIFEAEFAEHSYGFRPGRGAKDALRRVNELVKLGYAHVVDADLKSYFDTIPHEKLMGLVKSRVADGRMLALVEGFLKAGVMEATQGWKASEQGTPQGGVISPLLANLYLNPLDHEMARQGWEMVRYADDFVILCRSAAEAEKALEGVRAWVKEAGLTLHPTKTRLVDLESGEGFDFLGYHFERGRKWPRKKSLEKLKETICEQTGRTDGRSFKAIIAKLNRTLKGWFEYFKHSVRWTFEPVDGFVRRRLRSLLEKRRGHTRNGKGRAQNRYPNAWFAKRGLYSLSVAREMEVMIAAARRR